MSKTKIAYQLDLFGNTSANNEVKNNNAPIVFSNEKIAVKIKSKKNTAKENINPVKVAVASTISEEPITNKSKRGRKSFKEMDAEAEMLQLPNDETLKKKLYYPIREVAAFFNVNTSLIRVWETEFDIIKPRKNRKGDRLFRFEDIKNLEIIYYLLRKKKFSLEGAKKYLKENKGNLDTNQQLIQTLKKLKLFLTEIKSSL
ncbi:MAG: hypothetical protein AMXMBFR79_16610 [Chitinophagaceae bacterium]|nr:MerR family transcriptional regulator [Chitinophagales bacterium]